MTLRRGALFRLVLVPIVLVACAEREEGLSPADVDAIHALGQQFTEAIVQGNVDQVLAQRTADAVWMPPNGPSIEGPDAIRRQMASGGPVAVRFTLTSHRTEGTDDLAYDRGAYEWVGVLGTDTLTERGKYLQILRRQADGSWRIAVDIWSSDEPPVAPPPATRP